MDEARRSPQAPWELLVDAASRVWWLIGEYTQELTIAYRETAAELLLAGTRERSALVEALFIGGGADQDTLWEAAKLLRLPWDGLFVAVAIETPGLGREGLPGVEAVLASRGIGSAWLLHPDLQTGVVSLRPQDTPGVHERRVELGVVRVTNQPVTSETRGDTQGWRCQTRSFGWRP